MGTWLAVSSIGNRAKQEWWCFPSSAQIGDLVFIYQKGRGVYRVERVISSPMIKDLRCSTAGLLTASTMLVKEYANTVDFRSIRSDKVLSRMKGVSRSFQGTTFEVGKGEQRRLIELLKSANTPKNLGNASVKSGRTIKRV